MENVDDFAPTALLTIDQVARYLRRAKRTVERMVEQGKFLAPVIVGGAKLWMWRDIQEWYTTVKQFQQYQQLYGRKRRRQRTTENDTERHSATNDDSAEKPTRQRKKPD